MKGIDIMKCAVCGNEMTNEYFGDKYFGNNPWPVRTNEDDRCCDNCNSNVVIPYRIIMMSVSEESAKNIRNMLNSKSYRELIRIKDVILNK